MRVVCINDKNLPQGAEVVEGREYTVVKTMVNIYDEIAYIIAGVNNEGVTKFGLKWTGYKANRFAKLDDVKIKETEREVELDVLYS